MPTGPALPPEEASRQVDLYLQGQLADVPWAAFGRERPINLAGMLAPCLAMAQSSVQLELEVKLQENCGQVSMSFVAWAV